jgi:xylitol oxidase
MTGTNWAGNVLYEARQLHEPTSVDELAALVASADHLRALGSRHSFNRIADTGGDLVSVSRLPATIRVNGDRTEVTVAAGLRYGELVAELDREGLALHNLASLPHISVAGAVATGTHGSGDRNGSLATAVAGFQLVRADGTVHDVHRGDDDFDGMVVSLGRLGVLTSVTLDVVPTFEVRQTLFEHVPWTAVTDHLDDITASAYSVSLYTDWGDDGISQAWMKLRADGAEAPADLFGAPRATRALHPLPHESAESATEQLGVPGPWWARLPHFRMEFTPSKGAELQTEYLVPRPHALTAIDAVRGMRDQMAPHLFISEIRTVAADALWLSPSHSTDCVALHFTWRPHEPEVEALLPTLDAALAPFGARPHWGKVFATEPGRLTEAYPRLPEFAALVAAHDPEGTFANELTDRWMRD